MLFWVAGSPQFARRVLNFSAPSPSPFPILSPGWTGWSCAFLPLVTSICTVCCTIFIHRNKTGQWMALQNFAFIISNSNIWKWFDQNGWTSASWAIKGSGLVMVCAKLTLLLRILGISLNKTIHSFILSFVHSLAFLPSSWSSAELLDTPGCKLLYNFFLKQINVKMWDTKSKSLEV